MIFILVYELPRTGDIFIFIFFLLLLLLLLPCISNNSVFKMWGIMQITSKRVNIQIHWLSAFTFCMRYQPHNDVSFFAFKQSNKCDSKRCGRKFECSHNKFVLSVCVYSLFEVLFLCSLSILRTLFLLSRSSSKGFNSCGSMLYVGKMEKPRWNQVYLWKYISIRSNYLKNVQWHTSRHSLDECTNVADTLPLLRSSINWHMFDMIYRVYFMAYNGLVCYNGTILNFIEMNERFF